MQEATSLVKMVNIDKNFGAVQALKKVNVEIQSGEILGLLGDNGAGKSTLIKILAGVFPPDGGEIFFDSERVNFSSPKDARAMGIETVHQALSLVDVMSISRNFFLGREPTKKIGPIYFLDRKKMDEECEKAVTGLGVRVRAPSEFVSILSGGERQAISIGRAMHFKVRLLILDEPLTALSVRETKEVLRQVEKVREAGVSVIFITHNVYHVYPVAERFVMLDRGIKIGEVYKKDSSPEDIIEIIATGKMSKILKT
ncbi:MAG TPA: sugar ABC transporter ATP-binding protein [Candidatus Atribacteria bacterium]|nr:sugar ABC transporter ATP-binding protein [Candidatus Atribacteria bacterium]